MSDKAKNILKTIFMIGLEINLVPKLTSYGRVSGAGGRKLVANYVPNYVRDPSAPRTLLCNMNLLKSIRVWLLRIVFDEVVLLNHLLGVFTYLTEELVHESSFDGNVDVIGSDVVIVALRLQKENNLSASDNRWSSYHAR